MRRTTTSIAGAIATLLILIVAGAASAAAPQPCGGRAQMSDAAGDGHHINTDVLSAWLSESAGRLQAVIQTRQAVWEPAHEDSEAAGFALLFSVGGQTRYVRAEAPRPPAGVRYDHGTWTQAGGFVSLGATAGQVVAGSGGTVTIDVPPQTGAVAGAVLANPFVMTYDGVAAAEPHWVDRAPGGAGDQTPSLGTFGADYLVGSCVGSGGDPGGAGVSAVELRAPTKRIGRGNVRVRGSVGPARGGVAVELTIDGGRKVTRQLTTGTDGTFSASVLVTETTRLRAAAGGLRSQTLTITMRSKTRIKVRRLPNGGVLVKGLVNPALPGRVLLLRTNAIKPSAKTTARKGRFSFRFKHLPRGRYQAVFIPAKSRAVRSTSNRGVIR